MPLPIICVYDCLQQYLLSYRDLFSKPQYQYFVIVLVGFMQCQQARTLSGLQRSVAPGGSLSGLSRFLAKAPWEGEALMERWQERFRRQMMPVVQTEHTRLQAEQPKRRGRPKVPVVTGYLIGDDSTMQKEKGRKMEGIGKHHSTTHERRVRGHSLVQGLYVLLHRRCPLPPRLSRQQAVCERELVPFQSKIDLMIELIQQFEPVAGTLTHVLLDSWYSAKAIWKAARERGFLITTGLKCNRSPAISRRRASLLDGGGNGWMRTPPRSRLRSTPNSAGRATKMLSRSTCMSSPHGCASSTCARWSSCVARSPTPSPRRAIGRPAILLPRRKACWSTSRRVGTSKCSLPMEKKSLDWISTSS